MRCKLDDLKSNLIGLHIDCGVKVVGVISSGHRYDHYVVSLRDSILVNGSYVVNMLTCECSIFRFQPILKRALKDRASK